LFSQHSNNTETIITRCCSGKDDFLMCYENRLPSTNCKVHHSGKQKFRIYSTFNKKDRAVIAISLPFEKRRLAHSSGYPR
jgi:hypothetical protein